MHPDSRAANYSGKVPGSSRRDFQLHTLHSSAQIPPAPVPYLCAEEAGLLVVDLWPARRVKEIEGASLGNNASPCKTGPVLLWPRLMEKAPKRILCSPVPPRKHQSSEKSQARNRFVRRAGTPLPCCEIL